MKIAKRNSCDNKCAHGCSSQKQLARVVSHNQPVVLVLCSKAMNELEAKPYNTPSNKAA